MIVTVPNPRRARLGGSVDVSDFNDVPGCVGVAWSTETPGALDVMFDRDLTVAEQADVVARCEALGPNDETLRKAARAALAVDRVFLARTSPTNPQVVAQVQALTRQMVGLARITLQDLDGVD